MSPPMWSAKLKLLLCHLLSGYVIGPCQLCIGAVRIYHAYVLILDNSPDSARMRIAFPTSQHHVSMYCSVITASTSEKVGEV